MKNLPLGLSTLSTLVDNHCVYIDKTPLVEKMTRIPGRYFLSRPRRFGKSLLVDTFKELFEGNARLFTGLFIAERWDFNRRYPVIKLDFAGGVIHSIQDLRETIDEHLLKNGARLGIDIKSFQSLSLKGRFDELIRTAVAQYGQKAVILVDEYDKPILDNIEQVAIASQLREVLKDVYSVMKEQDANIQFVFMTGVSKFSKVSLFSGINQLNDITLSPQFSALCGYTQQDLKTSFAEHLVGVDWDKLKQMYNGYQFLGEPVYNPYDILLFIDKGQMYRNYWFETGSPSFLIKLFQQKRYFLPDLERLEVGEEILDSFEVEQINPVTLLFQTGYLTIKSYHIWLNLPLYHLGIPNQEVRQALAAKLIESYAGVSEQRSKYQYQLYDTLRTGDLPALIAAIQRLFAGVPWRNFTQNDLADSEGYYASVLYAFFMSLNATIIPEDISAHGQVDLTVQLEGYTYIMEIKRISGGAASGQSNPALQQIQARNYSEKYQGLGQGVFALGLVFDATLRNLAQADWVRII